MPSLSSLKPTTAYEAANYRLGVDFGGVITSRANENTDTSFHDNNFLETAEVPGAVDTLAELNASSIFAGNIWIISKASHNQSIRTLAWMAFKEFHDKTGIGREQVRFTQSRKDKTQVAS